MFKFVSIARFISSQSDMNPLRGRCVAVLGKELP
jgi:hypothetical protein